METNENQKLYAEVVTKAWNDENFKKEFVKNPMSVLEKLKGKRITIPEGKTLEVIDRTDSSKIYIEIPTPVQLEDVELTEEELEKVAGGAFDVYSDFPDCDGGCFPDDIIIFK